MRATRTMIGRLAGVVLGTALAGAGSVAMAQDTAGGPGGPGDATLRGLTVEGGHFTPAFAPAREGYAVQLPYAAEAVRITPTAHNPHATIRIHDADVVSGEPSAPQPIEPGLNVLEVRVTAQDGEAHKSYRLKLIREYPTPDWVQVLAKGPFPARDSAGELVFDDHLWLLGGYLPKVVGDVWRSPDGVSWERTGDVPAESGVNIPVNFVHRGRMWVTSNKGELFASSDGVTWELVNAQPPWAGRYAAGGAVFDGRMWVMGGFNRRAGQFYNDVWSSEDGVTWTQELEHAPWSPRQLFGNVVVKDGKLWVIGGGVTSYEPFRAYRDVWSSTDGRNWERVTDEAPWPGRIWSTCVVYRNRIFLIGGFRAQPVWENREDVWYSADGRTWKPLRTDTIWTARHETSAYVFQDKLWVVAGNTWPLVNDVWSLRLPGLSFVSQPVIEQYTGTGYVYHAEADFNESAQPVRYRLVEGPAWLAVDAATGMVHGVPPAAGEFPVVLEASDEAGETARQAYTLHVAPM